MSELETMVDEELIMKISNLPIQLSAGDVAKFLGISRSSAYKLIETEGFPAKRIVGLNRVIIPKKRFVSWYMSEFDIADSQQEL